MIYSITQFGNLPRELDLLKIRLAEELPHVDKFVIVEADRTHSGKPKDYASNAYRRPHMGTVDG